MSFKIEKREKLTSGNWLYLENIEYSDPDGVVRSWESAMRVGGRGAVAVLAEMIPSERIILVRQFRPPADGYVIEFPAGLIDEGEIPEETAVRELYEETGYMGKVIETLPPSYSTPGMTGETVKIVKVAVDEGVTKNQDVVPEFDDAEDIETFLVKKDELLLFLKDREVIGDLMDSKVMSYALGMKV
jgi:8-oxo-dGTP pyrophosphatase MutT (NUDIX family)